MVLLPAFLLALLAGPAAAGPVDLYGFDSRSMGRGGGGVALADGPGDVFRNPALLDELQGLQLSLGYTLARGEFEPFPEVWWDTNRDGLVDETDTPLRVSSDMDPADGLMFGLGRPVGERFGIAFAGYFPKDRLLRIDTFDSSLPTWFMYDNRAHRYELSLGFGWEQLPGLSVGGAVEVVTRVRLNVVLTLDMTVSGAEEGDSGLGDVVEEIALDVHQLEVDLVPSFAPVASLHWDMGQLLPPLDGLHLGAAFRGSSGLPVDVVVDIQGNVRAEDVGELEPLVIPLLAAVRLDIFDHYVPDRLTLGLAWDREPLRLYADLQRTWWNRMRLNVAQASGSVTLPLVSLQDPALVDGNPYALELGAVTSVRLGGEVQLPELPLSTRAGALRPRLRAGGGLEPSPLRSQGPRTALIDADRLVFACGVGVEHDDPLELVAGPVRWDLHLGVQPLATGKLDVGDQTPYRPGAPVDGASIPVGGRLWSAGLQWSFDF